MPELRVDPVTGRQVLVAPERAARPHTVAAPSAPPSRADCPFCPGHEAMTPPEVARTGPGAPDTPGWRVRVVPNLYPLVGDGTPGAGGAHEVLTLSPNHARDLGALDDDQAIAAFTMARERVSVLRDAGHPYVHVFVNHGRGAGASIAHPHAQLVALDHVPPLVADEAARVTEAGRDLLAAEMAAADRAGLTVASGPVRAWCPHASGTAWEQRIAHRSTRARIEETSDAELAAAALATRDAVARMQRVLGVVPYNVVVHTAPADVRGEHHWWIEVFPRIGVLAGFELGTGLLVNVVAPEEAAASLRANG